MLERWEHHLLSGYWWKHPAEILLLALAAWFVHRYVIRWLRKITALTETTFDDVLVDILDRALRPLLVVAVIAGGLNVLPLPAGFLKVANQILYLAALAVALYYLVQLLQLALERWLARSDALHSLRDPIRFISKAVFGILALVIVLENLGIRLTAVWTTLGVGSVAVALALQETLANFFAGFYLQLDRPIRVDDYVKLDSGQEGFVHKVSWRSTRIRTLWNNTVIVPNSKLASAVITNYSLPEPGMSLLIPIGVGYSSDPDQVERVLLEETRQTAAEIQGLLLEPAPLVRFMPGFGDSSLNFTLICRVSNYVDQYLVQHELRKRILVRFRREGIQIPFPQRDVHFFVEKADPEMGMAVKVAGDKQA
ncbi:MAG TPA: mechanosensitive ion channel family protein [Patescibacteria group bacterium]|nr:mechanosensitive ion channel family protein [Patescibacteria group bacterium]